MEAEVEARVEEGRFFFLSLLALVRTFFFLAMSAFQFFFFFSEGLSLSCSGTKVVAVGLNGSELRRPEGSRG